MESYDFSFESVLINVQYIEKVVFLFLSLCKTKYDKKSVYYWNLWGKWIWKNDLIKKIIGIIFQLKHGCILDG